MNQRNSLIAPLYVGLALWVAACGKDDGKLGGARSPVSEPAIASLSEITGAADRRTLVGRKVEATDVLVTRVVGNYFFWGGSGTDIPILLEGEMRGTSAEGDVRIRKGQRLRITGVVRLIDQAASDPNDPMWSMINAEEKKDIVNARVYIGATDVKTNSGARAIISSGSFE